VRKFGLYLRLAHQRFGQLDENITDAVLTNCRIKAVFGGLPAQSARLMAEELFIGDLDPKKIKVAIYQTKFWPQYQRDKVYTHTTSSSSSTGSTRSAASGSFTGSNSGTSYFQPDDWFAGPQPTGLIEGTSSGHSTMEGSGSSESQSYGESDSVADIPILIPVPFEELSSIQYYSTEEQLIELTAALKEQFPRHCFIKIHSQKTQPLLVPFINDIRSFRDSRANLQWYQRWQLARQNALPAAEVDRLLELRQTALQKTIATRTAESRTKAAGEVIIGRPGRPAAEAEPEVQLSIWNRSAADDALAPERRRRGPKPDLENHAKVLAIISPYGAAWTADDNLSEICEQLDRQGVPIPKRWPARLDGKSRSWTRGLCNYPSLVVKAIKDRCKAANGQA